MRRFAVLFVLLMAFGCGEKAPEKPPAETAAPPAVKKHGGQYIDKAKEARKALEAREGKVGDEVKGSEGKP